MVKKQEVMNIMGKILLTGTTGGIGMNLIKPYNPLG